MAVVPGEEHDAARRAAVQWLRERCDEDEDFKKRMDQCVVDWREQYGRTGGYFDIMETPAVDDAGWGGHNELVAYAKARGVRVFLYTPNRDGLVALSFNNDATGPPVCVFYDGVHYDGLRRIEEGAVRGID